MRLARAVIFEGAMSWSWSGLRSGSGLRFGLRSGSGSGLRSWSGSGSRFGSVSGASYE